MKVREARTAPRTQWGNGCYLAKSKVTGLAVEDHFVKTPDGYTLFMKRVYRPDAAERKGVVVMWHGSWENGNLWRLHLNDGSILAPDDLDRLDCFANWFADKGFDVFLPHLWGQRVYPRYVERKYPTFGFHCVSERDVSFNEMVEKDVPPVLDYIWKLCGSPRIFWVGHSTGGMLAYAYLATHPEEARITAAATLGSPFKLGGREQPALTAIGLSRKFFKLLGFVESDPYHLTNQHLVTLTKLAALLLTWAAPFSIFNGRLYEHSNINPKIIDPFLEKIAEPTPPGLLRFFMHMINTGRFASPPEKDHPAVDYESKLGEVKQPFLLIAGEKDRVALKSGIQEGSRRLGNNPASRVVVVENTGHLDLVVGKNAPFTMFNIYEFFSQQN